MSVHRALAGVLGQLAATLVFAFLALGPGASAQEPKGPYLELIEVIVQAPGTYNSQWKSVAPGHITMELYGSTSEHTWSAPPAAMDGNGFVMTLTAQGHSNEQSSDMAVGTASSVVGGFDYDTHPDRGPYFRIPPGQSLSKSMNIHFTPYEYLTDGAIAELWVGASFGPGVTYRYRVSGTPIAVPPPGMPPAQAASSLAASLECPGTIVISQLPSLNCHIIITGFERNTATPVEVILPAALDLYGNHANGIQVDGDGQNDVFNWDQSYSWGLFVFACPSQTGAGVNCYGSETTPGTQTVDIIVRQGENEVPLLLTIHAVGGGDSALRIAGVWNSTFGAMTLAGYTQIGGFYDLSGGTIEATLEDNVLEGFWSQPQGSTQKCDRTEMGSEYWGRLRFTFIDGGRAFTGLWGYCDEDATREGWDGTR